MISLAKKQLRKSIFCISVDTCIKFKIYTELLLQEMVQQSLLLMGSTYIALVQVVARMVWSLMEHIVLQSYCMKYILMDGQPMTQWRELILTEL